jgi:hypothetical protein
MGIYIKAKTQKTCFSLAVLACNTGSESRILGQTFKVLSELAICLARNSPTAKLKVSPQF